MKLLSIPLLTSLLLAPALPAAVLVSGTLSDYFSLPPSGGTIGTTQFSNFVLLSLQTDAVLLSPDLIMVDPIDILGMPALKFTVSDSASGDDLFNVRFSYTVSDSVITRAILGIDDTSATLNSGVTVVEDLDISGLPSQTLIAFRTAGDVELSDEALFTATNSIGVTMDITLDGGGGDGFAILGSTTNQFHVVPETGVSTLIPLAGILFLRRRRHA